MIALSPEQRLLVQKCYLHKCATKIHMSYIIEQHTSAGMSHKYIGKANSSNTVRINYNMINFLVPKIVLKMLENKSQHLTWDGP